MKVVSCFKTQLFSFPYLDFYSRVFLGTCKRLEEKDLKDGEKRMRKLQK